MKLLKKYRFVILISILVILGLSIINYRASLSAEEIQKGLADSIVRFHVVSASDSDYEQGLKILVKNAVLDMLSSELMDISSKEETIEKIRELTPEILKLARGVLLQNGSSASVSASVTDCYFPVKSYGDMTLPAGNYTAFKIVIGEGTGTNWWCVLYPRLCFVDATYGIVPEKSKKEFKSLLSEKEYSAIFGKNVVYRFKILTFLNRKNK